MLLAVAGLDKNAISERTRRLASGDWSRFSAGERAAFAFARKQVRSPASVTAEDMQELIRYFGPERTLDVIWWACHCHYMTSIAAAFQLPLERDNVFDLFLAGESDSEKPRLPAPGGSERSGMN